MAHRDAIVDADRVKHEGHAARVPYRLSHHLAERIEMDVPGDDVGVGVGNGYERFVEVRVAADDAGGAQKSAMRRPFESLLDHI